jgi:hypothetical protein
MAKGEREIVCDGGSIKGGAEKGLPYLRAMENRLFARVSSRPKETEVNFPMQGANLERARRIASYLTQRHRRGTPPSFDIR